MKWERALNSNMALTAMLMPGSSQCSGSTGMAIPTTGVAAMAQLVQLNLVMAFCLLPIAAVGRTIV